MTDYSNWMNEIRGGIDQKDKKGEDMYVSTMLVEQDKCGKSNFPR